MRAVVTFWWFPDEEAAFLDYLESTGHVVALPFQAVKDQHEVAPRPVAEVVAGSDPQELFFGLEEHVRHAVIIRLEGFANGIKVEIPHFRVSDMKSCVIGYDRGRFIEGGKMTPSNLYAYWDYPDEKGTVLKHKPADFVMWAKKVLRWVYKATPEWHEYKTYRVSKRVKAAIQEGKINIVPY